MFKVMSKKEIMEIVEMSKYWGNVRWNDISQDKLHVHEAGLLKLNCDKALYNLKWLPTLEYKKLIEFTSSWYFNFYKSDVNMLDFTINQIKEYQEIALKKEIAWTK
jgi:CDP-glucose 4,6-dehydratase